MRIQHNITAINSYRNYTQNANRLSKNLEKLSSGYKINRAGDDAAGLAISEKMRSQITGLNAAQKNVKDGISLVKTAEGALQEVHDMLNRMTYLATQSANGTYDGEVDRPNLQKELNALRTEIDRIADASNFNGQKLLDGGLTGAKMSTVNGTDTVAATAGSFTIDLTGMTATTLTNKNTVDLSFGGVTAKSAELATSDTVDANAIAAAFNGKTLAIDGKTYTISATGSTLKFEGPAEAHDLDGKNVQIAFAKTSTGNVTLGGDTTARDAANVKNGTAQVDATKASTTLDFTGKVGSDVMGMTVKYGGVTYQFVEKDADKAEGNTAVVVGKNDLAADLADKLRTAVNSGDVTDNDAGVVTFAAGTAGAASAAPEVEIAGGGLTLQIGDTAESFNKLSVTVGDMHAKALGLADIDISKQGGAQEAIDAIKNAINTVSSTRGDLGAFQNRLEHTNNNLAVMEENIQDAESTIRDTDVADEMTEYTKNNILLQSAQAMLAQANQLPQGVLQLLG